MKIENGVHTFSLTRQCTYSGIQNIIAANRAVPDKVGAYSLSRSYRILTYKPIGVEILLHQSLTHRSWMKLIVNPSSLLAGEYCPTKLFSCKKSHIKQVRKKLRWILDKLGIDNRLKEFKLNRVDLTRNLYCCSHAEVMAKLNIFKKSRVIPRYEVIKFKDYWSDGNSIHGANHHSWTIASSQNAFSAYDKTYQLRKRHGVEIPDEILRLELRLERKRIRQLTKSKTWEEQLVELYEQHDRQFSRFLHRLYQDFDRMLTLSELLEAIEASGFRAKTKKRMARLAKKMDGCESLTAARKRMKISNKDFIQLLEKFRKLGISPIPME